MELLGKKLGMAQLFDANGNFVGVTVIEAGPCTVLQKKTPENDGYHAVQLGLGTRKEKNARQGACRPLQEGQHRRRRDLFASIARKSRCSSTSVTRSP